MKLSQELGNQCSEMKSRYRRVLALGRPDASAKANRVLAATYALSCAALAIALNQLAGAPQRSVVVDKKAIRLLAARSSGTGLLEKLSYNVEQYNDLCAVALERRPTAMLNRFGTELHNALDEANLRLYALVKPAKA
ncbi:MAG: hypothetical protein J0M02_17305 [Planctomycetes bacterium]|nr:hypothetical protein [Planctomycetota bacterium]